MHYETQRTSLKCCWRSFLQGSCSLEIKLNFAAEPQRLSDVPLIAEVQVSFCQNWSGHGHLVWITNGIITDKISQRFCIYNSFIYSNQLIYAVLLPPINYTCSLNSSDAADPDYLSQAIFANPDSPA